MMKSVFYNLKLRHAAGYVPVLAAYVEEHKSHLEQLVNDERLECEKILTDMHAWEEIDSKFGVGSTINLAHPVMKMMMENPHHYRIIDPKHFENAMNYQVLLAAA